MKKFMAMLLLVALLLSCAGCQKAYKNQAPTLYITLGEKEIEKQGSVTSFEKMSFFSLKKEQELASYPFAQDEDYKPIYSKAETMTFRFEEEPQKMALRYYRMEDISKDVSTAPSTQINSVGGAWPLQEGGNFYELTVYWENDVSNRTARYVFYVLK